MVDKTCNQQVLGGLMQHPQYFSEVDKYNLSLSDFSTRFERYVFSALQGLYYSGAKQINPIDVVNYLKTDAVATSTFESQNGIEYLQDLQDFTSSDNFDYYYSKLKKLNLLRDLKKSGFDTSQFYEENLVDPKALDINKKFESLTCNDITSTLKSKLLRLESAYTKSEENETRSAADGLDDLVANLKEGEDLGLSIQGDILNQVLGGARRGTMTVRSSGSGIGKALPNSTLIPTPRGYKRVDEIQVGDYLFDAFGRPTKVLGVYPQGKKEVKYVKFKDGRIVKCCEEHLWSYCTIGQKDESKQQRNFYTKTFKEISELHLQNKKGAYQILVPNSYAVQYSKKDYFIPPYVFGLALGDGSFRQHKSNKTFQYSSEDEFLPSLIAKEMDWNLKRGSEKNYTWYFSSKKDAQERKENIWVQDFLIEYPQLINCKSEDKFIPEKYLYGDIEQRFDLLNGLLDSDGSVDEKGRVSFFTISSQLKDDVVELCRSLGLSATVAEDGHKETNIGYIVHIKGRPSDKNKLFKLPRKRKRMQDWYDTGKRKEKNDFIPIIELGSLGYEEEMTCFYVDNEEHLFLTEGYIVTHNTRGAVADACHLAYPIHYDSSTGKWIIDGYNEKVLLIITEQSFEEVQKMVLAYISDINEGRFRYGDFSPEENDVLFQSIKLIKQFKDNLTILRMPEPTVEGLKAMVREQYVLKDIGYLFMDYIFVSPSLLREFKDFHLRNDEALLLLSTALKDLAVELNICVFTSTQVNANADNNIGIRNESSIAGARSIINKSDNGLIMSRPTKDETDLLRPLIESKGLPEPNLVSDVFKVRSGQWTQVKIWSYMNLGTMKRRDLFITDSNLNALQDFHLYTSARVLNFEDEEFKSLNQIVERLNSHD